MSTEIFQKINNVIVIYPYQVLSKLTRVLSAIFFLIYISVIVLIVAGGHSSLLSILISIIVSFTLMCLILLPFFYISSKSIIIDGNAKTIFGKSLFGKKIRAHFDDVTRIIKISSASSFSNVIYELEIRNSAYSKNIKLISGYQKTAPLLIKFEQEALPVINSLLFDNNNNQNNLVNNISNLENNFTFFKQKGEVFTSPFFRYITLIVGLIFLILGLYGIKAWYGGEEGIGFYPLLAIAASVVYLAIASRQVILDRTSKTITLSYFYIFRQRYSFDQFVNFSVVGHLAYGAFANGNDLKMIVQKNRKQENVMIFYRAGKTLISTKL